MDEARIVASLHRSLAPEPGDPVADSAALRRMSALWVFAFGAGLWICDAIAMLAPRLEGVCMVLLVLGVGANAAGSACLCPAVRPAARAVRSGVIVGASAVAVAPLHIVGFPPWLTIWLLPAASLGLFSWIVDGARRLPTTATMRRLYAVVLAASVIAAGVVLWRAAPALRPSVDRHFFPAATGPASIYGMQWRESNYGNSVFSNSSYALERGPIQLLHARSTTLRVDIDGVGAAEVPASPSDPVVVFVERSWFMEVDSGGNANRGDRRWRSLLSCPTDAAIGLVVTTLLALVLIHRIRSVGASIPIARRSARDDLPHRTSAVPLIEDGAHAREMGVGIEAWSLLTSVFVVCPLWTELLLGW